MAFQKILLFQQANAWFNITLISLDLSFKMPSSGDGRLIAERFKYFLNTIWCFEILNVE